MSWAVAASPVRRRGKIIPAPPAPGGPGLAGRAERVCRRLSSRRTQRRWFLAITGPPKELKGGSTLNPEVYEEMATTEDRHWWFVSRRSILEKLIGSLDPKPFWRLLEVGSGTGGNLTMLSRFGAVSAMEMSARARELAVTKTEGRFDLRAGFCPGSIPFGPGERFDLICLFDVLEHIDEDRETLRQLRKHLAPDGRFLITVPAYAWMWGPHDAALHHHRRYSRAGLARTLDDAGLRVSRITHFNIWLFPLIALTRLLSRAFWVSTAPSANSAIPWAPLNALLRMIFSSEAALLARIDLPFGVSLLAVAHQRADAG
ncbi:MAG: methyltransferase domain-containing protein [Panacagrimonas sp.]